MPMRVHAHAAIWIDDRLVVHRRTLRGREHVTLPGGRVRERESVPVALQREVGEETGLGIIIGELLLAGEACGVAAQELILVFAAEARNFANASELHLLDPRSAEAGTVRPAVVDLLLPGRVAEPGLDVTSALAWVGNLYETGRST